MKKVERTRINLFMPNPLHEFVKEQANALGIPMSTMYVMIVNSYKDSNTALQALHNMEDVSKLVKKKWK